MLSRKTKINNVTIRNLPDHLILEIFSYFTRKENGQAALASKRFWNLANSNFLWENFIAHFIKDYHDSSSFLPFELELKNMFLQTPPIVCLNKQERSSLFKARFISIIWKKNLILGAAFTVIPIYSLFMQFFEFYHWLKNSFTISVKDTSLAASFFFTLLINTFIAFQCVAFVLDSRRTCHQLSFQIKDFYFCLLNRRPEYLNLDIKLSSSFPENKDYLMAYMGHQIYIQKFMDEIFIYARVFRFDDLNGRFISAFFAGKHSDQESANYFINKINERRTFTTKYGLIPDNYRNSFLVNIDGNQHIPFYPRPRHHIIDFIRLLSTQLALFMNSYPLYYKISNMVFSVQDSIIKSYLSFFTTYFLLLVSIYLSDLALNKYIDNNIRFNPSDRDCIYFNTTEVDQSTTNEKQSVLYKIASKFSLNFFSDLKEETHANKANNSIKKTV